MPVLKVPAKVRETKEDALCRPFQVKDIFYNMKHKKRGLALIFNHETFDGDLSTRFGTTKDRDRLQTVLTNLGFKVEVFNDMTCKDIFNYIQEVARQDHTQNDCLLITVLTHGELGKLHAKDTDYKLRHLWFYFTNDNCPTLAGKPKIFFIQACRGTYYDNGITLLPNHTESSIQPLLSENASHLYSEFESSTAENYAWNYPDFVICFATAPGYYSWRNTLEGSWFIQSLCDVLAEHAMHLDILTMLTLVSQKVALEFESYTPDQMITDGKKEIPTTQSTLTRILHFNEGSAKQKIENEELSRCIHFLIFFFLNLCCPVNS